MYKIIAYTDVTEDSYEYGELNHVNSYIIDGTSNQEDPREALEEFIRDNYHGAKLYIDEDRPQINQLVDNDNIPLDDHEMIEWREGRFKAYNAYTTFTVYKLEEIKKWN